MRKAFHQVRNYFQGAGHGHSDFHDGNAPASNHFGGEKGIFRGRSADGRNDSNFLNLGADLILVQRVSSEMLPASRVKVNSWASMICVKLWVSAPWMISFTTWHETGQEHAAGRIAARFSDSGDMRAGNPNSFARRIGLWAFAAFSMLLALEGRGSAAPGGSVRAARHFTVAYCVGDDRPGFVSLHVRQQRRDDSTYCLTFL